jgi:hypothetical protein
MGIISYRIGGKLFPCLEKSFPLVKDLEDFAPTKDEIKYPHQMIDQILREDSFKVFLRSAVDKFRLSLMNFVCCRLCLFFLFLEVIFFAFVEFVRYCDTPILLKGNFFIWGKFE